MKKMIKKIFPIFLIICIFMLSGCFKFDAEYLIKQNAQVKAFLNEYPDAEMLIVHLTKEQTEIILPEIRQECESQFEAKEYYKASIKDLPSGLSMIVYLDFENKRVECLYKKGTKKEEEQEAEKEKEQPTAQQLEIWKGQCKLYCSLGQVTNFCEKGFKQENTEEYTCTKLEIECSKIKCPQKGSEETIPDCEYEKIEEKCVCGRIAYRTGYCCDGRYSLISCTEQPIEEEACVPIKLIDNDYEKCESAEEKTVEVQGLILSYRINDKVAIGGKCVAC